MIGLPQRRVAAAAGAQAPVVYPADYCVFGQYWIGRTQAGGYQIGDLTFPPSSAFNSALINYDNRTAAMLSRTVPENDAIFICTALINENDKRVTVGGSQFASDSYHRSYTGDYQEAYAVGAANGGFMRTAFSIGGTWPTGVTGTRSVSNDRYLYQGGTGLPFSFEYYVSRSSSAIEHVRSVAGNPVTYQMLSSEQTGIGESSVRTRFITQFNRIIISILDRGSNFWTWDVSPYTGSLANGRYRVDANGNLVVASGNFLPTHQIATFVNERTGPVAQNLVNQGERATRAATLESSTTYLKVPNSGFGRDDTSVGLDPIWNLYGGAVRINSQRQVSVNNGPWFVPMKQLGFSQSPWIMTLGDRWVRDLGPYLSANPGVGKQTNLVTILA